MNIQSDWSEETVQSYLSQNPQVRAIEVAEAVGCTEAEALSLMSEAAWKIPRQELSHVLAEVGHWQPVMVLVRNRDAVAEIEVPGNAGYVKGDWLNWIDPGYNLHIRLVATDFILALVRPGKSGLTYSFNLVNQAGDVFCRFYTRTPEARDRFYKFCQGYTPLGGVEDRS